MKQGIGKIVFSKGAEHYSQVGDLVKQVFELHVHSGVFFQVRLVDEKHDFLVLFPQPIRKLLSGNRQVFVRMQP